MRARVARVRKLFTFAKKIFTMCCNLTKKQCRRLYSLLKVLTKIFTLFVSIAAAFDSICDVCDDGMLNDSKRPLHDLVDEGCAITTKLRSLINNL